MNFWEGKRIRLRGVEPQDAEFFYHRNLDSERARMLDFVWPPSSLAQVKAWTEVQSQKRMENDALFWVIETLEGMPAGSIDTHHCSHFNGTFSYAMDITPELRRCGYASEAIYLVLKYYFQELRYQKATISAHADNVACMRLHEKLGFQVEGRLRNMVYSNGQYLDEIYYGLTRAEFLAIDWEAK